MRVDTTRPPSSTPLPHSGSWWQSGRSLDSELSPPRQPSLPPTAQDGCPLRCPLLSLKAQFAEVADVPCPQAELVPVASGDTLYHLSNRHTFLGPCCECRGCSPPGPPSSWLLLPPSCPHPHGAAALIKRRRWLRRDRDERSCSPGTCRESKLLGGGWLATSKKTPSRPDPCACALAFFGNRSRRTIPVKTAHAGPQPSD